jgi:RNA polymerase sigma-70 factor (ECF subfamily)
MTAADPPLDALLAGIAAGNRESFALLYRATRAKLYGVVLRILRRHDLAEEVLQDAFLTIWQRAGEFRPEKGAAMTWMATVVRHRAIDRVRRQRPERSLEDSPEVAERPDPAPLPLDRAIASAERRALEDCMDTLEPKQKDCILAAFHAGLTHEEVAERLTIPLGTVKSWIRRGLMKLKGCLEP